MMPLKPIPTTRQEESSVIRIMNLSPSNSLNVDLASFAIDFRLPGAS